VFHVEHRSSRIRGRTIVSLYSEDQRVEDDFGEPDFCPACGAELTCFGDCPECDNEADDE
jgi:hypothetical protein